MAARAGAAVPLRQAPVQAPLLPESAVMSDGQGNFVYVVGRDNKVVRRNVTVGEVSDAGAVIAGGLMKECEVEQNR